MVSKSFVGGLAARALYSISGRQADQETYTANTLSALTTLQGWYNESSGLWDTTGWWNSANCLTVLADFVAIQPDAATEVNIPVIIQNTFEQAQKTTVTASKQFTAGGIPMSTYTISKRSNTISERGFDNFLNDYYDDEGWWALALIHSADLDVQGLGDQDYLGAASTIFEDMKDGASPCGGIYWSKVTNYTASIANELYLSVAASLANRMDNKQYYLYIALAQWDWFKNSGLINSDNLINDGLDPDTCENNGGNTWTYNQGVILGGLVELYKATGDSSLLDTATSIAYAAIDAKSKNGVLYEGCEPDCGADGAQFKGIFMRNLHYLQKVAPQDKFQTFILDTADSIWANDRDSSTSGLGVTWSGPYETATAGTQSSALDALVAAIAVA
ncbi:glycoside hydrolase [Pseudomassariella vexata]|uniref:Glycoside hydrolase n=1 Tax=Pseudomassariella vexata TaxID=1141098 RepID=A0A1Y2DUM6_9PEZI|nr:glycoside hydrolase [Pseudomassariella vexata]ORY62982.1 glycoside hydrolase [Pseudomassariella vexata]